MKFLSDILAKAGLVVDGNVTLNSVANATTDTDKFLTIDSGVVKFRTGAQLLSDIGGQAALTNPVTGTGTSGQVAYFNGTNSITSNAAFAFTPTSQLLVNNSVTAASAIARGINFTPTLVAAANSDVLVGLDINPTFTNSAFTGVSNIGLRLNNTGFRLENGISGSTTFYNITTNSYAFTNRTSTTSIGSAGSAAWGLWDNTRINGFFGHGGSNVNIGVSIGGAQVGAWFATGNLFVGSSPADGGFKLDVNGTARVSGAATLSNLAGTGTRMVVADANGLLSTQAIASGSVTGTGTTNYIPKFTSSSSIGNSIIFDDGNCIGINTSSPYSASQFKLDVNGGFIVKNTSGVNAQFVMINSDPAAGGNNAFFVQTVGGSTTTTWAQIQTYYGTSIAAGALRLQPAGGQILVGTTTASAFTVDINGTLRVSGQLTLGSTITNGTFTYTLPGATGTLALTSDITTAVANLVASAPGALDTLNELAAALGNDAAFSTTVTTALGNRLRVDTASQGLTGTQQGNGRTNLGLGSLAILSTVGNANITDLAYSKLTGVPSTFAPSAHTHVWTDITDRPTNLSAFTNGPGYITSSSLSSYVPYTGATTSVDLGTNNMSAQLYRLEGTGSSGAYLAIKQYAGSLSGAPGYTSIYAVTQNSLYIRYSQTDGSQKNVELSSALLGTTTRQYLFPNASGTFALTSDIPTVAGVYLPLSGGTLTGALTISTATSPGLNISKDASVDNRYLRFTNSQVSSKNWDIINQTNANNNEFVIYNATDNLNALRITATGSGIFSSSVTSDNLFRSNVGIYQMWRGGTFRGGLYVYASVLGSGTDFTPTLYSESDLYFATGGSPTIRFIINSSGNVGIGTTTITSGYRMEVAGDILLSTASGNRSLVLTTNNANAALNTIAGTGLELATDGTNRNLAFRTGTTTAMYINSSANVGIGTTSPLSTLHVNGSDAGFRITGSSRAQMILANGLSQWQLESPTGVSNVPAGAFGIIESGVGSRLTILTGGDIGIGTTAPLYRLEVQNATGDDHIAAIGTAPSIQFASSNSGPANWGTVGMATATNNFLIGAVAGDLAIINRGTTAGNILFGFGSAERARFTNAGQLRLNTYTSSSAWTGTAVATLGVDSSGNVITVTGGGGSSQWTTTGSDIYYNTGNVAIGATSTTRKLYVVSADWDNTNGGGVIFENSNTVGAALTLKPTASVVTNGSSGWAIYAGGPGAAIADGNLGFWAHGTNAARMVIQRAGNVGIGTTTPSDKLEVRGADDGITISSIVANRPVLKFVNGSTTMLKLSANGLYGAIADNTGNDTVFFKDGRVGIGTTSPVANLHIASNTNTGIRINATASNGSAELDLLSNGTQSAFIDYGPNQLRFRSTNADMSVINNGSVLVLDNGGNVGIGNTSPTHRLTIQGTSDSGLIITNSSGATRVLLAPSGAQHGEFALYNSSGNATTYLGGNGGNNYLQAQGGNVGIGTASPAQRLDVRGYVVSDSQSNGSESAFYLGNSSHGLSRANLQNDIVLYTTAGDVRLSGSTASTTHLIVKNSGDVGIGTNSPAAKFEVEVASSTNTGGIFLDMTGGGGGAIVLGLGSSVGPYIVGNTLPDGTVRGAYGASRMGFTASGFSFDYSSTTTGARSWSTFMSISSSGAATFSSSITCTSLTETSTIKVKENIVSIDSALDQVEKLQAVSYNRKGSSVKEIGLIAEAVEEVYPEFVQYDQNGEPVGLNYSRLTAVLIESVKELKKEIDILKQKN